MLELEKRNGGGGGGDDKKESVSAWTESFWHPIWVSSGLLST
jgi:hypothetical protein